MPNRILKESICTSDTLDKLNSFQETVFYRLIVNCDDFGRMDARPKILAAKLYPLKDIRAEQIANALQALSSAGLVILYEVDGKPFMQMKTWERHQQIRAKKSKYPAPDGSFTPSDNNCNQMQSDAIKCPRNPIQSNRNRDVDTRARPLMTDEEMDEAAVNSIISNQRLFEAMENAGMNTSASVIDSMQAMAAEHGIDAVVLAIEKAAEHDKKGGVSVAYVRSILTNKCVEHNTRDTEARRRADARTLARLRGELPA